MERIGKWLRLVNDVVWGPYMLAFLLGTGVYLMIRMRFLPLRNLGYALKCVVGLDGGQPGKRSGTRGAAGKKTGRGKAPRGDVSPFSSLMTELAATIGTGNIVGVATAMVLGGPGALVWMVLSALLGLSTKFAESMLSVTYRTYNEQGKVSGGPMYTLARALPDRRLGKRLGALFAVFAVLASFGMGNMTQANSISASLEAAFGIPPACTGLAVSSLTILAVLGGISTIGKVTQVLVPAMAVFYVLGAGLVIWKNLGNLPEGAAMIWKMAFSREAVAGGIGGNLVASMSQAMRWGVSRGVFSNEAGLGAAGISAAAADTDDPVRQGYISMTGVFLDTAVICTVTGLMLAASGVLGAKDASGELLTGTALTIAAFSTAFGAYGAGIVSIGISLFAFATIIGWAYQGEKAFEYLAKKPGCCLAYRFLYGFFCFIGAVCTLEIVWDFSDIMNALMAVPNLLGVLLLSKTACDGIRKYETLRKGL
ncbi:MAG: sodium:alanine symporter family protein [Clostridium sp.]|jgi:AGCS family alanine or glycine:cation symporter|nr:sodium:alanine symporter family protein [Clostridium sp.]